MRTITMMAAAMVAVCTATGRAADKPNVVLIMTDDMGYECVAANGGAPYKTPVLDKLAAGGVRFTNCHAQPLCTPSRVQIMTGRYNSRNYIRFGLLDPEAKTFGHMMRDAGYATCIVGKWQLGGGFDGPKHFGFDEYCLWQLTRRPNRYANPGLEVNGKEIDYNNGEYGPDIVNAYALDFITRHKDKPFFLYYPMILTHYPFEPTPDSKDWDPKYRRGDKAEKGGHGDDKHFADMVAYADKMVGNVIAKLDELGLRENSLVIFTGDNGTLAGVRSMLNGTPYVGGKGTTRDNGTHVPLIVSMPGRVTAGAVREDLVDFSDVLPTLAEVSGAAPPAGVELDGRSIWPRLTGKPGDPRRWVYCWYYRDGKPGDRGGGELARTARYKVYRDGRFYDIEADPDEKRPIADADLTPQQVKLRDELRSVVDRYARTDPPKKKGNAQ